MKTALIGYTGFVGSNIMHSASFTDVYNSKNIHEIEGRSYDLVVCSGVSAVMWIANKEPEKDWANIQALLNHLSHVKTAQFVHISTVDVYPNPIGVTEEVVVDPNDNSRPYGKHRLQLELEIKRLFRSLSIIRLPALFGEGIKKNFIYDLIQNRMLDYTHPDSEFQYYNLRNIWYDILFALHHSLPTLNIASEPLKAGVVAKRALDLDLIPTAEAKALTYNMQTKYDRLRGTSGGYLYHVSQVLPELVDFIRSQKARLSITLNP